MDEPWLILTLYMLDRRGTLRDRIQSNPTFHFSIPENVRTCVCLYLNHERRRNQLVEGRDSSCRRPFKIAASSWFAVALIRRLLTTASWVQSLSGDDIYTHVQVTAAQQLRLKGHTRRDGFLLALAGRARP